MPEQERVTNIIASPEREADLFDTACTARSRAYAPYSGFAVGAALRAADGQVFGGCNVENISFGLTICAERAALAAAVSAGCRAFTHLTVVTDTPEPVAPCGACRQVLAELAPDLKIRMANLAGASSERTLKELLPEMFSARLPRQCST